MSRELLIRVLGPIDVLAGTRASPLGSRNQRALLATLVVAVGHAVPIAQLRWAIWGDHPPEHADASIHTYVSRLRHLLGSRSVIRAGHAYQLTVDADRIDAVRFELLLRQATEADDPSERAALCRAGLALWRGEPFGDLGDDEAFQLESARLTELRAAAMEIALTAEIELDGHELAVAELESAVEEHPYRERLWYLLIEALRSDDRRVEALRACHRLRSTLADAGLRAGEELVELERRILDGETTPADAGGADGTEPPDCASPAAAG